MRRELSVPERAPEVALEDLQRIAGVGSWVLDLSSREMWWSPETFRILGLAPEKGKNSLESFSLCIHPDDREGVLSLLFTALDAGRPFGMTHRVVHPTGAVRHLELRGEASADPGRCQGSIQDVTDGRRVQEKIRLLANYDSLTGLANRRLFAEQLERAIAKSRAAGRRAALLYLDLDQFKRINDTLGHSAGDLMLQHVSQVIFDTVRGSDVIGPCVADDRDVEVSRLGGDEFAIVLSGVASIEVAGVVANRIHDAITEPVSFENHRLSTTASIGIALAPEHGEDAENLVKHADTAMYKAKARGRNNHAFYAPTMDAGTLRRLELETHLRSAIEREELRVVYQPRLYLSSGRIESVEALLRWDHPELGAVTPGEFIPVAEETGLIVSIGEWVMRCACAQAAAWTREGYGAVRVSVNVSSRQVIHHDLRGTTARALADSGLDPRQLELEITESVVLVDDAHTAEMLRALGRMGVSIALDDFGTGYSSLSYLTRYPLDTLQLDRSLVTELGSEGSARGVATAVIAMAHALDLRVTAEGVDAPEQARFLRAEGCDELQGFLIAGPMDATECQGFFGNRAPEVWDEGAESDAAGGA